jgi:putative Holliday junction resolvase
VSPPAKERARKAVLAIDHGTKRTGFAASDALRIATRPLEVWSGPGDSEELIARVAALVHELDADTVLVGSPLNMDGSLGPRALEVRRFVQRLSASLPGVAFLERDERLSTKAAEELLREAGFDLRAMRARRDSWSALVVLRDWLEEGEPRPDPSAT